jgi:AcrR family transcriptional regulator
MTAAGSRSADTHQALMDAALRVFVQRGFARATTREIAATAGVAEGTIYRHFADKHALFREVFFSVIAGMGEELRRFPERAGSGTVRDNLEYLFGLLGTLQERTAPLMASVSSDPELASSVEAHVRDNALEGFELSAPAAPVAAYISAEQGLGRIRADVDATEAAAVVVALPFARGTERALGARLPARGGSPEPQGFPTPAAAALDILAQGLAPSANGTSGGSH